MEDKLISICEEFISLTTPSTIGEIQIVCLKIQTCIASTNLNFLKQDFILAFNLANVEFRKARLNVILFKQFDWTVFFFGLCSIELMFVGIFLGYNTDVILTRALVLFCLVILVLFINRKVMSNYHKCFCLSFVIRFLAEQRNLDVVGK